MDAQCVHESVSTRADDVDGRLAEAIYVELGPGRGTLMADALRAKGLPVAYLAFEGEQHGFRRADTIIRCLEAELYFYGAVFGFMPADPGSPIRIANLS